MTEEEIETVEIVQVDGLDINSTDRVYQAGDTFVKVRIVVLPDPEFGTGVLEMSGSEVDALGAAIPTGAGWKIAAAERHTIQSDRAFDLAEYVETIRRECVRKVLRAGAVFQSTEALRLALGG